jgi:putative transposase
MLALKAYRFRIYPSQAQIARLSAWEAACRYLWNLAHEQRLLGLSRERAERRYYTAFDQINEITGLRADLSWLADVPRDVCNALLVNLDLAWQRCFKKLAREPNFKRKFGEQPGLSAPHPKSFRIRGDRLIFLRPEPTAIGARAAHAQPPQERIEEPR